MVLFKCKMCGGDIHAIDGAVFGTCDSCGTTSTLPKANDEKLVNLFNRANHFRRLNDFDKALTIYENILTEDSANAEAHWCVVLCRYGIEYVEDPRTHERVPTCHRTQYAPILTDADYLGALENAPDGYVRGLYETEAKRISDIQKGILAISGREEPFDVFICYKEATDGGSRTKDSTIAQDIYYQLQNDGYRVFFAKITLEDKLGREYEPYIFAALNSAKVMLVVGTKPEHFNAVWVKNEWSRFLALMKDDRSRLLIPCYRDMDAYDMPDEFSHLQALDMSKIGFAQDLVRGVKKVLDARKSNESKTVASVAAGESTVPGVESLMKRGWLFLEDSDWKQASEYFDRVLDIDPEYAQAYAGKLCAELNISQEELLSKNESPLAEYGHYKKAIRFADTNYRARLEGYNQDIQERLRLEKERIEQEAERLREEARRQTEELRKAQALEEKRIKEQEQREIYEYACKLGQSAKSYRELKTVAGRFESLVKYDMFGKLVEYQDAQALANKYNDRAQAAAKKEKILKIAISGITVVVIAAVLIVMFVIVPAHRYNKAVSLMEQGQYAEAAEAFNALHNFRDSPERAAYAIAELYLENDDSFAALQGFRAIEGFLDATDRVYEIKEHLYQLGEQSLADGDYIAALQGFHAVEGFLDATDRVYEIKEHLYQFGEQSLADEDYIAAFKAFSGLREFGFRDSAEKATVLFGQCRNSFEAYKNFISTGDYSGFNTFGLRADGTVLVAGSSVMSEGFSDFNDIVAISGNLMFTVGLRANGTVVAVGSNDMDQLNVDDWQDIVAISAGGYHNVGLRADGTVVAVGISNYTQLKIDDWRDIVAISAGNSHIVGLIADGTVVTVGINAIALLEIYDWQDIVAISAGGYHDVGLRADGTVVAVGNRFIAYGRNNTGQLNVGDWRDIVAIAAGQYHTVGLRADGTVVAVGSNDMDQLNVDDWLLW